MGEGLEAQSRHRCMGGALQVVAGFNTSDFEKLCLQILFLGELMYLHVDTWRMGCENQPHFFCYALIEQSAKEISTKDMTHLPSQAPVATAST